MDQELAQSLTVWAYVFCIAFAACVGSFSNVVIWRVPRHESIVSPPSACPKCGNRIKWYDNVPILSWLCLRGKCRHCHNPISPRYIIVEAIAACFGGLLCHQVVVPLLPYLLEPGVMWQMIVLFVSLTLFAIGCLALALIDYDTTELPPEITLPMTGLGLITALVIPETGPFKQILGNIGWMDSLLGGIIGGGIVITIIGLYYLKTRRIGMGGGDIWMMAMIGAFLGWEALTFVFLASSLQGILVAVAGMAIGAKQKTKDGQGLFRNEVSREINAEMNAADKAENTDAGHEETASDNEAEEAAKPDAEAETAGQLAIPYGPFIALAGVEYLFLANILLPWMSGNTLSPWGWVGTF